jgi:SPP1 gp7 family putative phage head morphogenesis protein
MPGHADPIEAVIRQTFTLQRLNNAIARDSSGILESLFDDIAAEIARIDPTGPAAIRYQRARIAKLVTRVERLSGDAYAEWNTAVRSDLARLGRAHGQQTAADLVATLGVATSAVNMAAPTQNMVKAILDTNPFQGETLAGWAKVQQAGTVRRVRQIVQRGMMEEQGIGWLVRQVRGGNGVRGAWQASRREAEAIVRTAVTEIASRAQMLTYQQNPNVVSSVQWISALDSLVCVECAGLDGTVMSADNPDLTPPAHMQCRCALVPIVDWEKLGLKPPEEGERFARDQDARLRGESLSKQRTQVPGDTTYETWLRGQKPAVQNDILGPGRAKLFRGRKMPLDRMVGTDRRILTLAELEKKVGGAGARTATVATTLPTPREVLTTPTFATKAEAEAFAVREFADTVDADFIAKTPLAKLQDIFAGLHSTLSPVGVRVNRVGFVAKRGSSIAQFERRTLVSRVSGERKKITQISYRKTAIKQNQTKSQEATRRAFEAQKLRTIATQERVLRNATVAQHRALAEHRRAAAGVSKRWSVDSVEGVGRLETVSAHEASHAVYFDNPATDKLWKAALKESDVSGSGVGMYRQTHLDWFRVSEYGASSFSELWAEVGALVHTGRWSEVPEGILKAYKKVMKQLAAGGA